MALTVELRGLVKSYGDVRAVNGLDLNIRAGETVALLGRNGAGKSTTISMMLGFFPPDEGSVAIFGQTPEDAVRRGRVGAMPQEGGLVPRISVKELLTFLRQTYPNPMSLGRLLEVADLSGLRNRRVDKLSGGQAQRVRFAMALAGNPDLVVLDEPTAALDVEARRALWSAMRAFAAGGKTVLFSTHYLEEADENADRIVVIDHGQVVADGTSAKIKQHVGGRVVSFDLGVESTHGLDLLPGVVAVDVRGHRVYLRTVDSDATVSALHRSRDAVRNLEISGAALEDAFVALTGGVR